MDICAEYGSIDCAARSMDITDCAQHLDYARGSKTKRSHQSDPRWKL